MTTKLIELIEEGQEMYERASSPSQKKKIGDVLEVLKKMRTADLYGQEYKQEDVVKGLALINKFKKVDRSYWPMLLFLVWFLVILFFYRI